jgi:phosphatidylglycerophosphatase A
MSQKAASICAIRGICWRPVLAAVKPVVPGTMGSLAAIPFWYLMTFSPGSSIRWW